MPPLLDSRKHTRANRVITATISAPDRSQDGALARSGPTAINERRNATTVLHINMRNRPLERGMQPYRTEYEHPMTGLHLTLEVVPDPYHGQPHRSWARMSRIRPRSLRLSAGSGSALPS